MRLILILAGILAILLQGWQPGAALAQSLDAGSYYWYVPEHEKSGRTEFFSAPAFSSAQVRVSRAQRFKIVAARKGWALLEFDYAGKAYVHLRLLRVALYDPAVSDIWYEFRRASVFSEDPAQLEARMRGPVTPQVQSTESKLPAWKRYKEGWNVKSARTPSAPVEGAEPGATTEAPRPVTEKKARNSRYPLLPPIGAETPREPSPQDAPAEPGVTARP